MSNRWSPDKIIRFFETYEQLSCLWDVNSDLYKNREARDDAYLKMAQAMDCDSIESVKFKIRSLRNAYILELTKIAKSKKSGARRIYKPKVPWFQIADRILHNVVQTKDKEWADTVSNMYYFLQIFFFFIF